ncbi:MAG: response regulator transcription factor [Pseudomonadota bacterium]
MAATAMALTPQSTAHILVVEDDIDLNQQLCRLIQDAGYEIDSASDGSAGLVAAAKKPYDLIIMDITLPKRDGLSVLGILRKTSQVPVIILTARGAEEERIVGYRSGADDYIAKPFNSTELLLRIQALLRRSQAVSTATQESIQIDELRLNTVDKAASVNEKRLDLTPLQFKFLWELGLNRGEVLNKAYLSQQVLNVALGAHDRSIDMHLSRVRRKLNQAGWQGDRLHTVRGKGYCLK